MSNALTIRIPSNSTTELSHIDRLRIQCEASGIEFRCETMHLHTSTLAPLEIRGDAEGRDRLAQLLRMLKVWAFDLNKQVLLRFTLHMTPSGTLIETTAPVAGRGQVLALMADIGDAVDILIDAGVLPPVSRILLDPHQRLEAVADVGRRAAYIADLTTRAVRVAGGAGSVPEPAA